MKLKYGKNMRFELWGGSAVGLGKSGTILIRRSARLLALVQDMGSIPIRRQWELAVDVGAVSLRFGKGTAGDDEVGARRR